MRLVLVLSMVAGCHVGLAGSNDNFTYWVPPEFWVEDGDVLYSDGELQFSYANMTAYEGDAGTGFFDCKDDSDWNCISSGFLNFALNAGWANLPQRWTYKEMSFVNHGERKVRILDHEYTVYEVFVERKAGTFQVNNVVYFSPENGIQMFLTFFSDDEESRTFVSHSKKGLLANKLKSAQPNDN